MKIALIQCPLWGTFDPPIGLAQLTSYLKKQGHQVEAFDLNIKLYLNQGEDNRAIWAWEESDFWHNPENVEEFFLNNSGIINHYVEQILKDNIGIVGFSVNVASRLFSLEFARRLKHWKKGVIIVFGGPIFLKQSFINDILGEDSVDIVIPGEGILAFSALIDAFKSGKEIDSCKGLMFKRGGAIINTGPETLIDLNSLPFLDFANLDLDDYDDGTHISLMASRGCVRRCVFCSDAPCWPDFRVMSGKRIFEELKFHKDRYNGKLGHIDFIDLVFNGNINSLIEFCDLMIKADLDLSWTANMYIRPEMTHEVIKKMKAAKCVHIIIGIESGSERVLRLMNKYYSMADADRIIKQMYEEGICVTANFMFGFPGEAEEDFELTLDFLRRNGKYMGVYPSRTYCALEEFSYLDKHLEEFGIKLNPPNHLFWDSVDGKNTYPERLSRCRKFCQLALELGVEITVGVQTTVELDEWFNLGCYYESVKDYPKAVKNFLNYFYENPGNTTVKNKLLSFQKILSDSNLDTNIKDDFEKAINIIMSEKSSTTRQIRADRPLSSAFVKLQMEKIYSEIEWIEKANDSHADARVLIDRICKNISSYRELSRRQQSGLSEQFFKFIQRVNISPLRQMSQLLNKMEFKEKDIWLHTFPVNIYLPLPRGKDSFRYIFELQEEEWDGFDLGRIESNAKARLDFPFLFLFAKRCILMGGRNFSLSNEAEKILDYFEQMHPGLEKELFTNGVNISRELLNKLGSRLSNYIINFALHASHRDLHRKISNKDNFNEIVSNLEYISKIRKRYKNIVLNIIYTTTALNIIDLPNVIRLAAELRIDKVIVDYNRISTAKQKDISCFFKQDTTNKIFDTVQAQAEHLNLTVQLPPKFNQNYYPKPIICRNPWCQLVLNSDGRIFPCEHFRIWDIKINDVVSFQQILNIKEFITIRSCFARLGYSECSMFCYYVNPKQVNFLRSHIFNAKYFGFKNDQGLQEDLNVALDKNTTERIIDLAECCLFSSQDLVSSERILKDILEKTEFQSRIFRLLAGLDREKAALVNSTLERERLLKLAQEEVENSLAMGPYDPWTYFEAARIYSVLGHQQQAQEAIERAISLEPQQERFKLFEQELAKN
jgi:radical SAM superfamily enzyme YgiQ (UPF0313 family)